MQESFVGDSFASQSRFDAYAACVTYVEWSSYCFSSMYFVNFVEFELSLNQLMFAGKLCILIVLVFTPVSLSAIKSQDEFDHAGCVDCNGYLIVIFLQMIEMAMHLLFQKIFLMAPRLSAF